MQEYRGTAVKNVLIVTFLVVQLALPIHGFLYDKLETRANFTWNMYSKMYACNIDYTLHPPNGPARKIEHWRVFNRPERAPIVFHRDVLLEFHVFLCDTYETRGELGRITADVRCSENREPTVPLTDPEADICTARNHGVLIQ